MELNLALHLRLTDDAQSCSTLTWFRGTRLTVPLPNGREGRITRASFVRLNQLEQKTMYDAVLESIIVHQESNNMRELVTIPIYCAGGCGLLLHDANTLTPRAARDTLSLRSPAFTWDDERDIPVAHLSIAMHCMQPACILEVQRLFRDGSAEIRRRNPEVIFRRHCALCGATDTPDAPFKRCSRCKVTCYCSDACQRGDWAVHRPACPRQAQ